MTDNPGMLHCGSLVPRPSPQKNGGRREPGNIRVKADFRRLDLAEIAEQNHVNTLLFSRRCLHCCANAQIVDTELNAPGQSTYLSKAVVREGHWSDLTVHGGLFAGPARSSFVAAYRIDGSQGELSWLVSRTSVKLGMP